MNMYLLQLAVLSRSASVTYLYVLVELLCCLLTFLFPDWIQALIIGLSKICCFYLSKFVTLWRNCGVTQHTLSNRLQIYFKAYFLWYCNVDVIEILHDGNNFNTAHTRKLCQYTAMYSYEKPMCWYRDRSTTEVLSENCLQFFSCLLGICHLMPIRWPWLKWWLLLFWARFVRRNPQWCYTWRAWERQYTGTKIKWKLHKAF